MHTSYRRDGANDNSSSSRKHRNSRRNTRGQWGCQRRIRFFEAKSHGAIQKILDFFRRHLHRISMSEVAISTRSSLPRTYAMHMREYDRYTILERWKTYVQRSLVEYAEFLLSDQVLTTKQQTHRTIVQGVLGYS